MKAFNYTYILLAFLFFSCKNQNIEPSMTSEETVNVAGAKGNACTQHYYYYNNAKSSLGTVSTAAIIIGFAQGVDSATKANFIASHSTYIQSKETYETHNNTVPEIYDLKPGLTCTQVEELLVVLNQSNLVSYANPTFMVGDEFRGIGGQFIVTLNANATYADLQALAKKTNTTIVEEISAELRIYTLSADKTSNGNALDMANYFHKQRIIQNAEPDFVLQSPGIGIF